MKINEREKTMTKITFENFQRLRTKQINQSRKPVKRLSGYLDALESGTLNEYHKKRGRRKKNEIVRS